jgi:cobalt-zinc-cadmium efflux system membrane fusion protein
MTWKTTVLLAAVFFAGLALGAWGIRQFGGPDASPSKEAADSHEHDAHEHAEKPHAADPHDDHHAHDKEQNHAHEGHGHEEHGHDEHGHAEEKIVRLSEARRKELGIEVAVAQAGSLMAQLHLSGTVALNTDRLIHIVPRIPGIVREVRKHLGDPVRAGDVMAVMDSRELADAKAAYLAAGERIAVAEETFQREKDLWEKKISPAEDYFKAKQALAEARIEWRLAKQKLVILDLSEPSLQQVAGQSDAALTRYEIVAPLAGTVIEKHLTIGESVKDDTEIFSVADLRTVWVTLHVPPTDLHLVQKGKQVRLSSGVGGPEAEGSISYIGARVLEETRTVPVRVELPNPEGRWRPGLFVTASLATRETTAAVLIHKAALETVEGKPSVFVPIPEGFEARPVTVGQSNDTHVEITAGLRAGERYAASETFLLKADLAKSEAGHAH